MGGWAPLPCELCGEGAFTLSAGLCPRCTRGGTSPEKLLTRDRLLEVLAEHVGATQGIPIERLVLRMIDPHRGPADSAAAFARNVRALVMQLRLEGHHICAHPRDGYYLAARPSELDDTCRFLVDRAMTSLRQAAAMKHISLPDLYGQLHLPT